MPELMVNTPIINPSWLNNKQFHASHRGNLLRKNAIFYSKYGWTDSPSSPYMWPTKIQN